MKIPWEERPWEWERKSPIERAEIYLQIAHDESTTIDLAEAAAAVATAQALTRIAKALEWQNDNARFHGR